MKKRLIAILITVLAVLSCGVLFACDNGKHSVSIDNSGNGTVSLNASSAVAGTEIVVTLTPDEGYAVGSVEVGGEKLEVTDNVARFSMPDGDVTVIVVFEKRKYAFDITSVVGGTVTASAEGFESGSSATLVITPDFGYELISLTVDGTDVNVTNGRYTMTMPEKNVTVTPVFGTSLTPEAKPADSILTLSSSAPAGAVATADYYAEFGDDAFKLAVYVADGKVITTKDGLQFYFGTTDRTDGAISEKNTFVQVLADGTLTVSKGNAGAYRAGETAGFSAVVNAWSAAQNKVTGYTVELSATYAALGITAADKSKLTLLPYLLNSDMTGLAFGANEETIDEYYSYLNPDTYPCVSASSFADNYYMFGSGAVGAYKNAVAKGAQWNTSKDYDIGHDDYARREITLDGHDNADNNIAFIHSAGRTSFVKAKFKITGVHNANEAHAKFGLMVFDTSAQESGVFFYVNADASKDSGVTVGDITGTTLGYNSRRNGDWGVWTTLNDTSGSLDLTSKEVTLAVAYNKGFIYMYNCTPSGDTLVGVTAYNAKGGNIVIGMKCFGLGLSVTEYIATNSADAPEFIEHNTRPDGQTIGDNESGYAYTEGWTIAGDLAQNTGAGDQIIYIKDVLESANFYAEARVISSGKIQNSTDAWTKIGLLLRNESYNVFGYIDLGDSTNRKNNNFAIRKGSGAWSWDVCPIGTYGTTIEDKADGLVLGIAKLGEDIYLFENGKIVMKYSNPELKDEEFVVGIMGFNRNMLVTEGSGSDDIDFVVSKIGMDVSDSIVFDGVLDDDVWTADVLAASKSFAVSTRNGTKVDVAAVKGERGVYVAVEMYTKTQQRKFPASSSWSDVTNIEFKLAVMTDQNKNSVPSQYIAFHNRLDGGVTSSVGILNAASKTVETELKEGVNGYKTTIEFYIPYEYFDGEYSADVEEIPFYVWTCSFDDQNLGAMNSTYKTKALYITDNGLVEKSV